MATRRGQRRSSGGNAYQTNAAVLDHDEHLSPFALYEAQEPLEADVHLSLEDCTIFGERIRAAIAAWPQGVPLERHRLFVMGRPATTAIEAATLTYVQAMFDGEQVTMMPRLVPAETSRFVPVHAQSGGEWDDDLLAAGWSRLLLEDGTEDETTFVPPRSVVEIGTSDIIGVDAELVPSILERGRAWVELMRGHGHSVTDTLADHFSAEEGETGGDYPSTPSVPMVDIPSNALPGVWGAYHLNADVVLACYEATPTPGPLRIHLVDRETGAEVESFAHTEGDEAADRAIDLRERGMRIDIEERSEPAIDGEAMVYRALRWYRDDRKQDRRGAPISGTPTTLFDGDGLEVCLRQFQTVDDVSAWLDELERGGAAVRSNPGDSMEARLMEASARSAFVTAWITLLDEQGTASVEDPMSEAPATSAAARKWAHDLWAHFGPAAEVWEAIAVANDLDPTDVEAAEQFAHDLAQEALRTGNAWEGRHGLEVPAMPFEPEALAQARPTTTYGGAAARVSDDEVEAVVERHPVTGALVVPERTPWAPQPPVRVVDESAETAFTAGIVFDKAVFNVREARAWAAARGFDGKLEQSADEMTLRLDLAHKPVREEQRELGNGLRAIVGYAPLGGAEGEG